MQRAEIGSLNQLAKKTGLSVETLVRLVHGEGTPSGHTLDAVSDAFRAQDSKKVYEWAGQPSPAAIPDLPEAARRLTPKQWAAVHAVITAMADPADRSDAQAPRHLRVARKPRNEPDSTVT